MNKNDFNSIGDDFTNSDANKALSKLTDKANESAAKIRTGVAHKFNSFSKKIKNIKTIADLAKIDSITQIMIIIIIILFVIIFIWGYNKLTLNDKNCKKIDNTYDRFPLIKSIDVNNDNFKPPYKLRDYYIKSAYNCCSSGNLKNDFVNLCALRNCIKQGARFLDFEIYSVNNLPVIAVSSKLDFNVKESYNSVPFSLAMETISNYAFSGSNCPNPDDPLILHFRIMTSNTKIHDAIAKQLHDTLSDHLLSKKFSYENKGRNIGSFNISKLLKKIIIVVDKSNPIFVNSLLNEYVNITSNSAFIRTLRFHDIKYTHDREDIKFYNKQNMSIILPNLSTSNKNYSYLFPMEHGCQIIALSFQNFDENMKAYTEFFDENGYAFVLKPEKFRYIPHFIDKPPAANKIDSYAPKVLDLGAAGTTNG
jgi:hypothetical protein